MDFIDEQILKLNQKHSDPSYVAPSLQNVVPQDETNNEDGLGTWLQAAGIGASNMLNNTIFGGLGQVLGTLGASVENFSPFSGNQDDKQLEAIRRGIPLEQAEQLYPNQDSWLTSLGKASLEAQNAIGDTITDWRNNVVGDNPSYGTEVAEGTGSSLGFMGAGMGASALAGLAGLGPVGIALAGILAAGGLEALSESGGTLGEAYRQGRYDDGGLAAANKSFAANLVLNSALDYGLGFFSPLARGIRNPITKFGIRTLGQIGNELLQEPSQQTIEKAAQDSLNNGGNFITALGQRAREWPEDFTRLAPSVAGSSLITSILTGAGGLAIPSIRNQVRDEWRNRMYDPQQTANELKSQMDARQKLLNQLQREQNTLNDAARISQLQSDIAQADSLIETLRDRLKPGNLDYTPNPYDEFSGNISRVIARDGENPIDTAFTLVDAGNLITSHNDDFSLNPDYNQANQNRDRAKTEAQNHVIEMSDKLDPASLGESYHAQNGAPIVDGNNQVISGNGRVLAIRRAYQYNKQKSDAYRQFIIDNAQQFGVDPDLARRMDRPVLVRTITDGQDFDLADFARKANEATVEELSAGNIAANDVGFITDNNLLRDFDPNKPISEQSDFLTAFGRKLPPNQQNSFFSDGKPTKNAADRVRNAILAVAYRRKELLDRFNMAVDEGSRNILEALRRVAPAIAKIQYNAGQNEAMRQDLVIGDDIAVAALWLERFRAEEKRRAASNDDNTVKLTVKDMIEQADIQNNGESIIDEDDRLTPERKLILQFLHDNIAKPNNLRIGLLNYANIASQQKNTAQVSLFDDATPETRDKMSILREAFQLDKQQDSQPQNTPQAQEGEQLPPQTNSINPQGSPAVINRFADELPSEKQMDKSSPMIAPDVDPRNLQPVSIPRNTQRQVDNSNELVQGNSESISTEQNNLSLDEQSSSNSETSQLSLNDNNLNPNDAQARGNLGHDIGNRSQVTNFRSQSEAQTEQAKIQPVEGPFAYRNFLDDRIQPQDKSEPITTQAQNNALNNSGEQANGNIDNDIDTQRQLPNTRTQSETQSEQNDIQPVKGPFIYHNFLDDDSLQGQNDESFDAQDMDNAISDNQQQDNSQQTQKQYEHDNNAPNQPDVDNRGYKTVEPNYIPQFAGRLKQALRKGKSAVRYLFSRFGDKEAPSNPQKTSFDAKLTAYDGYIGDFQVGIGDNSSTSHAFFGLQYGQPFIGLTDSEGNFVATYDVRNNRFYINQGYENSGFARRIEDDFRREFGNNPTEELLRRWFMYKAINAGQNHLVADATSRVYIAGSKYFAHYSGQSLLDLVLADNISIKRSNRNTTDRGDTTFIPQIKDENGNIIQEARTLVSLYRNADESTMIHETAHIFLKKLKDLFSAGLLKKGSQAALDWGIIMKEYGLQNVDFLHNLTERDLGKWKNAQEKFAASLEKYFWNESAPKGLTAKMFEVFNHFKEWLKNIYRELIDITYTDKNGRKHNDFYPSKELRGVFGRLMKGSNDFSLTERSNSELSLHGYSGNQSIETFSQSDNNSGGFWGWLKRVGKHLLHPLYSIAHVAHKPSITDNVDLRFSNPETERRFTEAGKPIPRLGIIGRINQAVRDTVNAIKGGDYADITNSPRIGDKGLNLLGALQAFRNLERAKKNAVVHAMKTFADNLRGLNPQQRDLFNRFRVLQDLDWQIKDMPDSQLPFGLDKDSLQKELKRITPLVTDDKAVWDAVQAEERTLREINDNYTNYAKLLGMNMDTVFRNPHYYRHRIIQYAQVLSSGYRQNTARGNIEVQDMADTALREIFGRGWLKKRQGSTLDFVTDYVQANAEVRMQMLQDIETMKTLLEIKRKFDIAPKIRSQFNLSSPQIDTDFEGAESYSQSGEGQQDTIFDHIKDGFEVFDPNSSPVIEVNKSVKDNLVDLAVHNFAEQHNIPLDRVFEALGIEDSKSLMVIPTEIAETLRKMARTRHRGALAQAAKDLTTWWKRSVLFTPTRNLLYNIRNFTGDIDALIAGNPHALTFLPQAVKELTGWYTQHDKEGYSASQDLKDYIRLSGELGIPSLNLSQADAKALVDLISFSDNDKMKKLGKKRRGELLKRIMGRMKDSENSQNEAHDTDIGTLKKAWNLIGKFFENEHKFTEWREHLLRFAAYLDYKQQMEANKDGKPNNWGASIEDEVMAIDDIKERAFKMSNELLGAYDQVSEIGKQLRDMLIPFYSWMEVNMRRTWRLLKNGFKYGKGVQAAKQLALGKAASMPLYALSAAQSVGKLMLFTGALQLFNRFIMPDADDDLPNDVKYRPHLTLGSRNGQVYYFDRLGAIADALDWFHLDSIWLDVKDLSNGQQTLGGYLKKMFQAPFSKAINGLNPGIKMPIELAMGRSMFPDAFNPSTIRDPAEYIARSFGLAWPYKAITGKPHDNLQELSRLVVYSQDADEAAYFQTLDRVRQFQNTVLDKHFDGFASTARGRILQNLKKALRYRDNAAVRRYLREYTQADGTPQGLKASMKAMNPLHGLSEKEKAQFMRWLTEDDRKYLRKAMRYFHQLTDKYTQ